MADNQRHVEISLDLDPSGLKQGLQEAESLMREGVQRMGDLPSPTPPSPALQQSFPPAPPPPPPPLTQLVNPGGVAPAQPPPGENPYTPAIAPVTQGMATPAAAPDGSVLETLNQRLNAIQQMAATSPDIAQANLSRLQKQTLDASLKEPEKAKEYQELIDAIKNLAGTTKENSRKSEGFGEMLGWLRANAGMQLGGQVMRQVQSGNLFSAMGTGIGGLLGMLGGPAGMAAGSAIGGGIGGLIEGVAGGARGAREYERNATDLARRFGDTNEVNNLRNYNLGGRYGFRAEESLQTFDQLRQERIVNNAQEATPIVQGLQQLSRALGLNVEATTKLYSGYVQSGGRRGEDGMREYFRDIVGGAIAAGFEGNVDQYAEIMSSARMQIVQGSGVGVDDRTSRELQGVLANLTGTGSDTSRLLRDNPMMAQQALGTFMAMGGTNDPFGMGAGLLRLAGVQESALDRRFTTGEQQTQNAELALQFLNARLLEGSGMSASEFREGAQGDQDFVQGQLRENVGLQRQLGDFLLPGLLGRQATATDLRAFEQLSNLMIANGGSLPGAGTAGGQEVERLLAQLGTSPADDARQAEAERHNKQMEVMAHFQGLLTRTDQWMANIYDWIGTNLDLAEISANVEKMLDWIETGTTRIMEWAEANNVGERIGAALSGLGAVMQAIQRAVDAVMRPFATAATNIANPRWAVDVARQDSLGAARGVVGTAVGLTPPGIAINAARGLFGGLFGGRRDRPQADDEFNDTPPGGVVATANYNTFRFAPGDRIEARQAGPQFQANGSNVTLEDVVATTIQGQSALEAQHQEAMESGGQAADTLGEILDTQNLTRAFAEEQNRRLLPAVRDTLLGQTLLANTRNDILGRVEGYMPTLQSAIASVGQAISGLTMMGGGMVGGGGLGVPGGDGGGAGIASPLAGQSIEAILGYRPTQGQSFFATRNRASGRGLHAGIDFDRRIGGGEGAQVTAVEGGEASIIRIGQSANGGSVQVRVRFTDAEGREITHQYNHLDQAAAERALGIRAGQGSVQIRAGQNIGVVGATDNLSTGAHLDWKVRVGDQFVDPQEYLRARSQGGGDVLTQSRTRIRIGGATPQPGFAGGAAAGGAVVAAGSGGAPVLGAGYESLNRLGQQLTGLDSRFSGQTAQGRAALALGLGIGGTEVYSRGSTATDFFTRRGGTGNNMLGFAQFNLAYHRDRLRTPEQYSQFLADQLTGQRAQPNGRGARNWAGELAQAVQSGQVSNGQQLIAWMQRSGLGGSNWQGVDDGWSRVPGLADQLVAYIRGGGRGAPPAGVSPVVAPPRPGPDPRSPRPQTPSRPPARPPRNRGRGSRPSTAPSPAAARLGAGLERLGGAAGALGSARGGGDFRASINVSVNAPGGDPRAVEAAARAGVAAATDEFEQRWRHDPNPRNGDQRSPTFA